MDNRREKEQPSMTDADALNSCLSEGTGKQPMGAHARQNRRTERAGLKGLIKKQKEAKEEQWLTDAAASCWLSLPWEGFEKPTLWGGLGKQGNGKVS